MRKQSSKWPICQSDREEYIACRAKKERKTWSNREFCIFNFWNPNGLSRLISRCIYKIDVEIHQWKPIGELMVYPHKYHPPDPVLSNYMGLVMLEYVSKLEYAKTVYGWCVDELRAGGSMDRVPFRKVGFSLFLVETAANTYGKAKFDFNKGLNESEYVVKKTCSDDLTWH